jgi:hypothetical protein
VGGRDPFDGSLTDRFHGGLTDCFRLLKARGNIAMVRPPNGTGGA